MARTEIQKDLFVCPACKKQVEGRLFVEVVGEVDLNEEVGDDTFGTARMKLLGVSVRHSCVPEVTRGGGAAQVMTPGSTYVRDMILGPSTD